jgi:hypothetical protein
MSTIKPLRLPFQRLFNPRKAAQTRLTEAIYSCTANSPPQRWDDSMRLLCTITWDTELDISSLPLFTNRLGRVFHKLEFEIEMTCTGGSLDFAIYHDGKRQGSKNVVVDYEAGP